MGILPQPSLPNPPQLAIKPRKKKNIAQGELKKQRAAKKKKKEREMYTNGEQPMRRRWNSGIGDGFNGNGDGFNVVVIDLDGDGFNVIVIDLGFGDGVDGDLGFSFFFFERGFLSFFLNVSFSVFCFAKGVSFVWEYL